MELRPFCEAFLDTSYWLANFDLTARASPGLPGEIQICQLGAWWEQVSSYRLSQVREEIFRQSNPGQMFFLVKKCSAPAQR